MEKGIEVFLYTDMRRVQLRKIFEEFFILELNMEGNIHTKEYNDLSYVSCPFCTVFISEEHEHELDNLFALFGLKLRLYKS